MKKLFLPLVALAGAISANAVQYTQVTSLDDLTDGSTYVIEAYNHNWTQNKVMTLGSSAYTFESVSGINSDNIDANKIWALTVITGHNCLTPTLGNARTSTSEHHGGGKVVQLSIGGNYFTHVTWGNTQTSQATSTDATSTSTWLEIFTPSTDNGGPRPSGADENSTYFGIHTYWGAWKITSETSESTFNMLFGVTSSKFGQMTGASANNPSWCPMTYTTDNSSYFRIWKVETTIADKLQLLKDTYSAQCESLCTQFGITDSNYANAIEAVTATTEEELTTAEASLKQIVADVTSTICATYTGYFTIQHVEQSPSGSNASQNNGWAPLYYVGLSDNNIPSTLGTDMAKSSIWKLEAVADENSTTGISVTIYNPIANLYICPTNQSVGSNQCISTSSDASNYYLIPKDITNDKFALFGSTGYLHVQNLSTCQSWPTDVATDAPAQSQWYLRKATEEQLAAVYALTDADVDAKKGGKVEGTKLGQYQFTPSFTEKETAYTTGKTADFGVAATAYRDITATEFTTALNMPAKNSYLRIKGADGYVTANQDSHETEATAASIIWYSGETMVDYANGYAFHAEGFCDDDDVTSEQNTAVNISFSEASNAVGTYIITPAEGDAYNTDGLTLEEVTALPVALNGGVAAVCFPVDVTLPSDGKFYTCVCDGTNITVSKKAAGDVIAAGTAILISGDADVELPYTAGESTAAANSDNNISYNQLATKFTATDGTITYVPAAAPAAKAPALHVADADGETVPSVTFAKITSGHLAANTPAINVSTSAVPSGTDPVETFSLTLDPEQTEDDQFSVVSVVTSIEEINAEAAARQPIYDLQGRRVTATPTHGLFIFGNKIRRI
jgi:hypothetical protein